MSIKTEWQQIRPDVWEAKRGDFSLRLYKPREGSLQHVWRLDVLEGEQGHAHVWQKPTSPDLGEAKRKATKWLRQHTQPAPQDVEQAQAVSLRDELERLQAMEKRLREYVSELELGFDTDSTIQALYSILYGESEPHD